MNFKMSYFNSIANSPGNISGNTMFIFSRDQGKWQITSVRNDNPFALISTGSPMEGMPSGFITFIEDNTGFYFDTQTQTDDSTGDITGEIVWSGSPYTMYSFYGLCRKRKYKFI